ncbi:MAG: HIT domain-containing protein [Candidatus Pacebacteria bacterium]|nr:HIT domain-containing protein [Candidatus Paceibacterota bacterium]
MFKSNAPDNYACPICLGNEGVENEDTLLKQQDLIFRDDLVTVWINSFWIPGNEGHVIVVPNDHYENIYAMPDEVGHRIFEVSKMISKAMKQAYNCDGITLRQNNEPAGDQHAFHYHLHIFPRYEGDDFNKNIVDQSFLSDEDQRPKYAKRLKGVN